MAQKPPDLDDNLNPVLTKPPDLDDKGNPINAPKKAVSPDRPADVSMEAPKAPIEDYIEPNAERGMQSLFSWANKPIFQLPEGEQSLTRDIQDWFNPTPLEIGIGAMTAGIGGLGLRGLRKGANALKEERLATSMPKALGEGNPFAVMEKPQAPVTFPKRRVTMPSQGVEVDLTSREEQIKSIFGKKQAVDNMLNVEAERIKKNVVGTTLFDDIDAVKKNIEARKDWTPEFKAKTLAQIEAREISANGALPNNPGLVGRLNSNAKSLLTSADISAPGRQGLPLIRTKAYWTSLDDMFKAWGSEKAYKGIKDGIKSRPLFKEQFDEVGKRIPSVSERAKLFLPDILEGREERFATNFVEKHVPGIRASERAYTAFLNQTRADYFETLYNQAKASGKNVNDDVFLQQLANTINVATGRGDLGKLEGASKLLNETMFAPRYVASRFQMLDPRRILDPRIDPMIRKENLKNFLALSAASMTANSLYALAGAEVGSNTLTSDFAKSQFGQTRIDPNAGVQQPLVLGARLLNEMAKTFSSQPYAYGEMTGADYASQFAMSRLAPVQSFLAAVMLTGGKDFDQKPFEWKQAIINRATPIILQDMMDLYNEDPNLLPLIIPSALGQGVNTYTR